MKIALAQMKMSSHMEEHFLRTLDFINTAADNGADLICFPEVRLSPLFAQYKDKDASGWLITEDSRYVKEICALCRERRIYAVPNFYIDENGRRYDMSLLCYNGESYDLTIRFLDILRKWKIKQIFFSYAYLQEY